MGNPSNVQPGKRKAADELTTKPTKAMAKPASSVAAVPDMTSKASDGLLRYGQLAACRGRGPPHTLHTSPCSYDGAAEMYIGDPFDDGRSTPMLRPLNRDHRAPCRG